MQGPKDKKSKPYGITAPTMEVLKNVARDGTLGGIKMILYSANNEQILAGTFPVVDALTFDNCTTINRSLRQAAILTDAVTVHVLTTVRFGFDDGTDDCPALLLQIFSKNAEPVVLMFTGGTSSTGGDLFFDLDDPAQLTEKDFSHPLPVTNPLLGGNDINSPAFGPLDSLLHDILNTDLPNLTPDRTPRHTSNN